MSHAANDHIDQAALWLHATGRLIAKPALESTD